MSFPAYSSYRESGRRWLGDVPECWRVVPFWTLFRRVKRTGFPDGELLSVYRDYGVIRKTERDDNFNKPSEDLSTYQLVETGDLAINKMKAWQGSLGVSPHTGIVSPAYFVYQARHEQVPAYLHYLLRSAPYAAGLMTISKGIRINQWDVDPDHLSQLPIPIPSIAEQTAIATFLDRETVKIDALVAEQRRLIELLKEKRQAVISHAVTKGLDPTAPMKDSGVEWLGDVPQHWPVMAIKRVVRLQSGESLTAEDIETEGDFPVYGGNGVRGFRDIFTHDGDFVLIGRQGALCGNINYAAGKFWASEHALIAHPRRAFVTRWLGELLRAMNLGQYSTSAAQPGLSAEVIGNLRFAVPPLNEQGAVAELIESTSLWIDPLLDAAESAIKYLLERRAALISAAVTGKIDVRASAKVLPFDRARALVATEIIEGLAQQPTFGRVKLQKIAFLAEAHVGVRELAGSYTREAAGPLDRAMIDEMESGAYSVAGITVDQAGGAGTTVCYQLHRQRGSSRQELADWLGASRTAKLDKLIADFADLSTRGSEAVATLYGVWNDALIAGASPTDDDIIAGFLNDWHPEKRQKFRADELPTWLEWMRRHDIIPSGSGPKTTAGSLFT